MSGAAVATRGDTAAILVVDDEARNRSLLIAYLSPRYRVIEADSGQDALDVLGQEPVDLVLLDVMMPELSGFDACRAIKRSQSGDEFLPVILLTALSEQEDRNAGLEAGADDFLTKPVDRRELALRVQAFLRLRRQDALIRRQMHELQQLQSLKDDLFSLIVHDLRNPLAGVDGFLQLAREQLAAPELGQVRRHVEKALESARKLQEILNGVLEVRLLEQGEWAVRLERLSLRALVEDAVATVEGAAQARNIGIELAVAGEPEAELDRSLARRAVENLLGNALKYSRAGDVVSVAAAGEAAGVAIEVADRGPGIPDPLKGVLFQKFGSVEVRQGAARRGFGLGLYLVQLVTAAHGGSATVRDREGGGSVFRLFFPQVAPNGGASNEHR